MSYNKSVNNAVVIVMRIYKVEDLHFKPTGADGGVRLAILIKLFKLRGILTKMQCNAAREREQRSDD